MKCSFCGEEIRIDRAVYYYTSTGKSYVFCSSKCKRSMLKLNRDAKKLKWAGG